MVLIYCDLALPRNRAGMRHCDLALPQNRAGMGFNPQNQHILFRPAMK